MQFLLSWDPTSLALMAKSVAKLNFDVTLDIFLKNISVHFLVVSYDNLYLVSLFVLSGIVH